MTVPKWLVPLISVVAAIAIAIASVLIGMRFATHQLDSSPAGTQTVPILAPIASGDEALPEDPSQAVGEQVVNRVGTSDENPVLRAVIDEIAAASDPASTIEEIGAEDPAEAASGDPCAPVEGESPADCPEGLHGTVLELHHVRPVYITAQAFPPTEAEFRAAGGVDTLAPWCSAQTHTDSEAPFGIMSTVPATFTITYWPSDEPTRIRTANASSVPGRVAFEAGLEAGVDQYDLLQRTCLVLPGIDLDTGYTASVQAIDIYDNIATPRQVWFNSAGAPTRPGAEILTVGDNLLIASALHTPDQVVDAHAYQLEDGEAPRCSGGSDWYADRSQAESTVDATYLAAHNALPEYTQRSSKVFLLPEGSTFAICVRWYPRGGDVPPWEATQPIYESQAVVSTPDLVLPVVTLQELDVQSDASLDTIAVGAATAEGTPCGGSVSWSEADGASYLPADLCTPFTLQTGGARYEAGRVWDIGFSGDFVLTSTVSLSSGETAEHSSVLPLGRRVCAGECADPAPLWFRVFLPTTEQATGLCGSSFGSSCEAPSREVVAGSALVAVTWEQGLHNGQADWSVGTVRSYDQDYVSPDLPQLNVDNAFSPMLIDDYGRSVSVSYVVESDRPVNFTARLLSAYDAGAPCARPSAVTTVTGRAENSTRVTFSRLCVGTTYTAEVVMTDDAGRTATWSAYGDRTTYWPLSSTNYISTPGYEGTIRYEYGAQSTVNAVVSDYRLYVGGLSMGAENSGGRCDSDGLVVSRGSVPVVLGEQVDVAAQISFGSSDRWTSDSCPLRASGEIGRLTAALTIEDLSALDGVIISGDDYRMVLHLWLDPR